MPKIKKPLIILVNLIVLSLMFGLINNKIKWSIHNSKIKHGSIIIEYFDIKDDILMGIVIAFFVYVIYSVICKLLFKNMSTVKASLITAGLSYSISYLIIRMTVLHDPKTLWISLLPIFIIGLLLPFSERWVSILLNKIGKK